MERQAKDQQSRPRSRGRDAQGEGTEVVAAKKVGRFKKEITVIWAAWQQGIGEKPDLERRDAQVQGMCGLGDVGRGEMTVSGPGEPERGVKQA